MSVSGRVKDYSGWHMISGDQGGVHTQELLGVDRGGKGRVGLDAVHIAKDKIMPSRAVGSERSDRKLLKE